MNKFKKVYRKIYRFFDNTYYEIKWAIQRLFRGHADVDMWGLDFCFAKFILPRLKAFKKLNRQGFPGSILNNKENMGMRDLTDEEYNAEQKAWEEILDKMIFAMECIVSDSWENGIYGGYMERAYPNGMFYNLSKGKSNKPLSKELQKEHKRIVKELDKVNDRINEGLILFGKHFRSLWD